MYNMSKELVKTLALIGGTHGNELIGVYLINKFNNNPSLIQRDSYKTITLLGNPKAIQAGKRYIDTDLNRCSREEDLANNQLTDEYEQLLAKQHKKHLIDQESVDMIIDIHTTTSDMGMTLILHDNNPFLLELAAYLCHLDPSIKILQYCTNTAPCQLRSIAKIGLGIEVGPIPQGVLKADIFHRTEALIMQILDYIHNYNTQQLPSIPKNLTIYKQIGVMDYPRDETNQIRAMIVASSVKDYEPLQPNDPIFIDFNGDIINYQGNSTVWPVFVNEAAYVEKGIAFSLTRQEIVTI